MSGKRLLRPRNTEYGCNCGTRENCSMVSQCPRPILIYKANVENNANNGSKIYSGLAEISFKQRFANYNKDFKHEQYKQVHDCKNIYGC